MKSVAPSLEKNYAPSAEQQIMKLRIKTKLIAYRMAALSELMGNQATMKPEHRIEFEHLNEELRDTKFTEANLTYVRNML